MRVAERETTSWSSLYEDHAQRVWTFLLKLGLNEPDAEDALHEVFLIAARRLASFDPGLGTHRAWLFGIAANVVRAARRKPRESTHHHTDHEEFETIGVGENGVESIARTRLRAALIEALGQLGPDSLEVFVSFELEGIGCPEIANQLGIPVGTVYSRLNKAREFLRSALAPQREGSLHHAR